MKRIKNYPHYIFVLLLVIVLAFSFRFFGINFDEYCCQHPDERAIILFTIPLAMPSSLSEFMSTQSPLNPHFFAYGNLPLYLLKIFSGSAAFFNPIFSDYSHINLVGRFMSIIADITTLLLIFLLGKTLKNYKVGLAAAFIYACMVLPIQYSHFYTSDILLTTLILLTLWRSIKFYKKSNIKNAALVGISLGLALSTKISATPVIAAISMTLLLDFIFIFYKAPHKPKHWLPHLPKALKRLATDGLIIISFTLLTFMIIQPYAFIDSKEFIRQTLEQSKMTRDAYTFPYTLQYVGKIPYIYELKNLFLAGIGPMIFALSLFGIYLVFREFKKQDNDKRAEYMIITSFAFLYFLMVGSFAVGFMRYLLPIYPILAIFAGIALIASFDNLNKLKNSILKTSLKILIIILILVWPLTFISIYSRTNTKIEASNWILENIPRGKTLTHEIWDDQLPMHFADKYKYVELPMYQNPDDEIKWKKIDKELEKVDYLILASNRLYDPITKLSDCRKYRICYPKAAKFYNDLFDGNLEFSQTAEFTSYPRIPLFGISIPDQFLDESFTVYDHPKITIFKRVKN